MRITLHTTPARVRALAGFGLIEAMFGMAAAGMMFVALYAGLSFGFKTVRFARENTRATQIMLEKMETIRLYTWTQINQPGFIPTAPFKVPYYAVGSTNSSLYYTGQITIAEANLGTSYANRMKRITITLNWTTDDIPRSRSMATYIAERGLQQYVY